MNRLKSMIENPKVNKALKISHYIFILLTIIFVINSIMFQIKTNNKWNNYKLESDCWVTYLNQMTNNKYGWSDVGDNLSIMVNKVSNVNGNTIIDAVVLNKSSVGLSNFTLNCNTKKLNRKGKERRDGWDPIFINSHFYNSDYVDEDTSAYFFARTNNIRINAGSCKKITFIVNNLVLTNDLLIKIELYSTMVHYHQQYY